MIFVRDRCAALLASQVGSAQTPDHSTLQSPAAFSAIADPAMRSRALFHGGAQSSNASPLRELSSRDRPTVAGQRSTSSSTDGHAGGDRDRHCRQSRTTCHTERNFTLGDRSSGSLIMSAVSVRSAAASDKSRTRDRISIDSSLPINAVCAANANEGLCAVAAAKHCLGHWSFRPPSSGYRSDGTTGQPL
jgi:hypothetical protein